MSDMKIIFWCAICIILLCVAFYSAGRVHTNNENVTKEIYKIEGEQDYFRNMTVTAYTASKDETDDTPYETALMEKPVSGWTCAVSHDLMRFLGDKVYIEGIGVRRVNDLMNERFEKRVDVFVGTKEQARGIGKSNRQVVFYE